MNSSSAEALLTHIRALEEALSKCSPEFMTQEYYTLSRTRPRLPTHTHIDIVSIWLTSESYIDYYSKIATRLEALKRIYEAQVLSNLENNHRTRQQQLHHHIRLTPSTASNLHSEADGSDYSSDDGLCSNCHQNRHELNEETTSEHGNKSDDAATSDGSGCHRARSFTHTQGQFSGKTPRKTLAAHSSDPVLAHMHQNQHYQQFQQFQQLEQCIVASHTDSLTSYQTSEYDSSSTYTPSPSHASIPSYKSSESTTPTPGSVVDSANEMNASWWGDLSPSYMPPSPSDSFNPGYLSPTL